MTATLLQSTNAPLSIQQLEQLWVQQGGDPQWAPTMAGIAIEESGGRPTALNNNPSTGDYSVGLWQINYYGNLYQSRTQQYGAPATLTQPGPNASAAVNLLGNGKGITNWQGDAVAQAAIANNGPLTAAQVQAVLGGTPVPASSGGVVLTGASQQLGQVPPLPNFANVNSLNPLTDVKNLAGDLAGSLLWGGQMLQWTMLAGFVFLLGVVLMVCALLLFGVIFFGPAVGAVKGVTALTRIAGKLGATARSEPSLPSRAPAAPGRTDALDAASTVVASGPDLRTRRAQQDEREERRRRAAQGERRRVSRTHLENARFRREGFERPSWSRPRRTFERASSAPTDAQPTKGPAGQPARRDTLRRNETPRQAADRRRKAQRKRSSR